MKPIRIALAGAGAFGQKHLDALKLIDGVQVTSVIGRDLDKTREVAAKYGIGHATTSLDESLARDDVDAVILSHDHYDHMDSHTMKQLSSTNTLFYVPLGVKKILESWGCKPNNIKELNWWDEVMDGPNRLVATPARHFSGRSLFNRFETLWCSWSILGADQSVFYCGDSGHMDGFQDIRQEIGSFDLTIMPIGAYHPAWRDIHTNAEEAHDAHITLGGKVMLPVHWGTFDLALHPWDEPIEHLLELSQKAKTTITTPQIGEEINFQNLQRSPWWRK